MSENSSSEVRISSEQAGSYELPPDFVSAKQCFHSNLARRAELLACVDEPILRWAERIHPLVYLPGLMSDVYVQGYENFPERKEPAPIVALAHKKLHDFFSALVFMAGRPLERFHDVTLVAQAGLFYGIYTYRDLIPDWLKRGPLLYPVTALARIGGFFTNRLMRDIHAHPVFRDEADLVPESFYYGPLFAGHHIMKMNYAEYVKHAGRTTLASVVNVQKELVERNRAFVIFPEGLYCHDGSITELGDLAAIVAFRKERPIIPVSLSYDELCTDRFGRMTAWVKVGKPIPPPTEKKELTDYLAHLRETLQKNTTITASNLIAAALQHIRSKGQAYFDLADFKKRFDDYCMTALNSGFPIDGRLRHEAFRQHQLEVFLKTRGKKWFHQDGQRYYLDENSISKFDTWERSVDDVMWNVNNIRHLSLK